MNHEPATSDSGILDNLTSTKLKLKQALYELYLHVDALQEDENIEPLEPHAVIITNFREKNKHPCNICEIDFVTQGDLLEHNNLEHPPDVYSDARRCFICEVNFKDWESRNLHMSKKHYDVYKDESQRFLDDLVCCCWCRTHFSNTDEWKEHWSTYHYTNLSPNASWMNVKCDKKGMNIVSVGICQVHCTLCNMTYAFDCNVSRFEASHGKIATHREAVKTYIAKHDQIPVRFLRVVDMHGYEIPGEFHPHEIQSSCCCRIYSCQFCTRHASLNTKFKNHTMVLCKICNKNIQWIQGEGTIDSPSDHIASSGHQQHLKEYMLLHGKQAEFMDIFKNVGQTIPTVSRHKQK